MTNYTCGKCCFKRKLDKNDRVSMFKLINDVLTKDIETVINCSDCTKRISIFNNTITTNLPDNFFSPVEKIEEHLQMDFFELMRIEKAAGTL